MPSNLYNEVCKAIHGHPSKSKALYQHLSTIDIVPCLNNRAIALKSRDSQDMLHVEKDNIDMLIKILQNMKITLDK